MQVIKLERENSTGEHATEVELRGPPTAQHLLISTGQIGCIKHEDEVNIRQSETNGNKSMEDWEG